MNAVSDSSKRSRIKHFVGLIRVSTGKQADDNMSLHVQDERIRAYASQFPSAELTIFSEVGSASKSQTELMRPVLHSAIEKAREIGGTLIVVRIDRLSRNLDVIPFLKGIRIYSLDQRFAGQQRLKELVEDAARESLAISEGSIASAAKRRARGEKLGNTTNLGDAQKKGCQSNSVRARKKVLDLAEMFTRDPSLQFLTHSQLCGVLNQRGFLNKRNVWNQVPWTKETIRRTRKKAMEILKTE